MDNTAALNDEAHGEEEVYFNKPNLVLRVKSITIDSFIIVVLMFIAFSVFDGLGIASPKIRGIALGLIFLYEPIFTSSYRTVGQKLMGLRVCNFTTYKNNSASVNINIFSALMRFFLKVLLGWLSLVGIHSDHYGQAFHDKMSNSLMTIER